MLAYFVLKYDLLYILRNTLVWFYHSDIANFKYALIFLSIRIVELVLEVARTLIHWKYYIQKMYNSDVHERLIGSFLENADNETGNNSRLQRLLEDFQSIGISGNDHNAELTKVKYEEVKDLIDYEQCVICLCNLSDSSSGYLVSPPCSSKHIFHSSCLENWQKESSTCPMCKSKILKL